MRWIADFRDPWSEWDFLDTLSLTSGSRAAHRKLEHQVLTLADKVITIAPYHVRRFEILSGREVELITNGFDEVLKRGHRFSRCNSRCKSPTGFAPSRRNIQI